MNVLVTGGAGYIGSHTVRALTAAGHDVVVYDDLSTGHERAVVEVPLIRGSVTDRQDLEALFETHRFQAVVHFAAKSLVGESMTAPAKYYANNVAGGVTLLEAARTNDVRHFVFSSTAAVYGEPEETPISEEHPLRPTSVYGRTKLMFEQVLADYARVYGMSYAALRYFNAAGAVEDGSIGEDHDPETHLIPIVLQAALGRREGVGIFGTDYPTPDGTCIRDYVHVCDLADGHVRALDVLEETGQSGVYNLGNGRGFSVREVIETAKAVTGKSFTVSETERRPGDPAVLVAGSERARTALGWRPQYASLEAIVQSAWNWHRDHPVGFKESGQD